MEVSNRAFGIFCVAVFGVVLYVRAQSVHSPATVAAAPPVVTETVVRAPRVHRGIPDSTLPPDPNAINTTSDDQPIIVGGDLPADQAPTSAPATTDKPATPPATVTSPTVVQENLVDQDDLGDLDDVPDTATTNSQLEPTDRDLLRMMMGTISPRQREEFRALWFTMSPDDRQNIIDEVRGNLQGG